MCYTCMYISLLYMIYGPVPAYSMPQRFGKPVRIHIFIFSAHAYRKIIPKRSDMSYAIDLIKALCSSGCESLPEIDSCGCAAPFVFVFVCAYLSRDFCWVQTHSICVKHERVLILSHTHAVATCDCCGVVAPCETQKTILYFSILQYYYI